MTVTSHENIMASLSTEAKMSKGNDNAAFVPDEKDTKSDSQLSSPNGKLSTSTPNGSPDKSKQSNEKTGPVIDFDDLLPHVGEFGRYQQTLFLLMIPFAFFVAFVYFSQIFITLVPEEHWCKVPELENLTVEQR